MGTSAPGEEGSLLDPCLGYGSGRGCLGVDGHHVCVKELPTKKTARRQDRTRRADTDPVLPMRPVLCCALCIYFLGASMCM